MANTYTQIYLHLVFAVRFRKKQIQKEWKEELYKYICGIVNNKNEKIYAINGVSDHIHILLSIKPDCPLSDLVGIVKANSSKWINGKHYMNNEFKWQEGFGAFSVSSSDISRVIKYIDNQEIHHQKQSFKVEYHELLDEFNVEYDERYLFDWLD
jgi:putative transposase